MDPKRDTPDPPSSGVRPSRSALPTSTPSPSRSGESLTEHEPLPYAVIAGRFHLLGRLGRGGIADVFAAHDDHTGGQVALKLLPAYGDHAAVTRARVEAEMTLSRSVTHPNVCRVIDTGHTED